MGMRVLFMVSCSIVLYCAVSGVNRVAVDLSGLSCRLLSRVHVCMSFRYGCKADCAVRGLTCVDSAVISSA